MWNKPVFGRVYSSCPVKRLNRSRWQMYPSLKWKNQKVLTNQSFSLTLKSAMYIALPRRMCLKKAKILFAGDHGSSFRCLGRSFFLSSSMSFIDDKRTRYVFSSSIARSDIFVNWNINWNENYEFSFYQNWN